MYCSNAARDHMRKINSALFAIGVGLATAVALSALLGTAIPAE